MLSRPSQRTRAAALGAVAAVFLSACVPISRWSFPEAPGPVAPFGSTSLRGEPGFSASVALAPTATPSPAPTPTPTPVTPVEPISQEDAQACLAAGTVVYGLALQNANVRQSANTDACRIGRIPKGSLVQVVDSVIEGVTVVRADTDTPAAGGGVAVAAGLTSAETAPPDPLPPTTVVAMPEPAPVEPGIGYVEDIQPIFLRTCNSCHSAVVRNKELQVTAYDALMKGSVNGAVVLPGDPVDSILWQMIESNKMPMVGTLSAADKSLIRTWIESGAPEARPAPPTPAPSIAVESLAAARPAIESTGRTWLSIAEEDYDPVSDECDVLLASPARVVSSELILPIACGDAPDPAGLDLLRASLALPGASSAAVPRPAPASAASAATASISNTAQASATLPPTATTAVSESAPLAVAAPSAPAFTPSSGAATGISAPAWGLPAPSDGDGWLTPRGGLCIERKLPNNSRGITALTFAPDGRLFIAFDSNLTGETDPLILYDAFHPSRAVAMIDSASMQGLAEIMVESTRITGMDWEGGALYLSRAGEVGRIPDGGSYEPLAAGFAVNSQLFHANNGLVIEGGWLYVSAGGVMDGYSDGPLVGIGEEGAQQLVSGGNPYAARIVRAPLDALLSQRTIGIFSTAARGARNPYGIATDPAGRIWFTDNGATNVPEDVSAGDEVNVLDPGTIGGNEAATPYFGFPLAILQPADWYSRPAVVLPNTSAPTGITWALGTIYYAQYGKDPGLYRIGTGGDGRLIAERIMLGWPILAVTTAPDGALWIGMGDGGLYRMTPGC